MLAWLLAPALAGAITTHVAIAAEQPLAHSGHFRPMLVVPSPPGADGTLGMAILSSVVKSDGTIFRSAGATAATQLATGEYEVDFDRDVSGCAYISTVGSATAGAVDRGQSDVAPRVGNPNGVYVETLDSGGNYYSLPFHLIVFCVK